MPTTLHPLGAPLWRDAARAVCREARTLGEALLAGVRRRQQQRATRRALGALDQRLLRDLGLDRGDIDSVAARHRDADRLQARRSSC
jgi:uncharacterized protein YjiS (DUF1127 family)